MLDHWKTGISNPQVPPNLFTQKATDSFAYSAGELASVSSGRWVKLFGTGTNTASGSGTIVGAGGGIYSVYKDTSGTPSNHRTQYATITVQNISGAGTFGLYLRMQTGSETGYQMYYDALTDALTINTVASGTGTVIATTFPGWSGQGTRQIRFSVCGIGGFTRLFVESNNGSSNGWVYNFKNIDPSGVYFDSGFPALLNTGWTMSNWSHGIFSGISPSFVGELARASGNTSGATGINLTIPTAVDVGDTVAILFFLENGNVATGGGDSRSNGYTVANTINDGFNSTSIVYSQITTKLLPGDTVGVSIPASIFAAYAICAVKLTACNGLADSGTSSGFGSSVSCFCNANYAPSIAGLGLTSLGTYSGSTHVISNAPIVYGASSSKKAYVLYYRGGFGAGTYDIGGGFGASVGYNAVIASFNP